MSVRKHGILKFPFSLLWMGNALVIFSLSITGRPLQYWIQEKIPLVWLGYVISAVLAVAVIFLIAKHLKFKMSPGILLTGILAVIILVLTFKMERPEEKVHLLLFGTLGFLSMRLFGFWKGLCLCLVIAGLDELLQLFLPSRVGDLQDIKLNSVAAVTGVLIGRTYVHV